MSNAASIHKELLDAWNRRDFQTYRSLLHPDYSYTGGDGKELTGGPDTGLGVARMYAEAFPDAKTEIKKIVVQGDFAVAEFVARGTHKGDLMGVKPTGKRVEITICNIIELRDGKAYREREYMDTLAMFSQLGITQFPEKAKHA